ncbi:NUDIX hydrolase [Muribaculum intestinale]|uniref:GDP-mannose pyrophosphatase n=2 Tax=Muribaculum intestinale TaxID=1796646 RepID=A0A1B1SA52_9BACT|nr:NUDIX hydrolase [Muribaculum intestinale]GFI66737.1 methanol dehydrogenase activator [Muribaculaceae bacterium]ANU63668.1 NUDIX hydrolase [Muribaculum intestinale]ASB38253.1 NUDIX hydrolase [Muribaculum intestinale]PWB04565.1 NUDIX hydrolase [Muribaculum intestinale]PWB11327.1 NUDIX hydrolase [Muribaculum intestinale]
MEKWTTTDSRYIIKRPWLTARCDTMRMPDGQIKDEFYVLEYPDWVNIIAITTDGKMVLVEQYRHGLDDIFMELCAGCVEPGEDPLAAAKRELAEETGFGGGEWELSMVLSANPTSMNNLNYCYIATGVELIGEQHLDPTEDINVHVLEPDEVKRLLVNDRIKQSLMAAPLWKYFAQRGECPIK